MDPSQIPFDAIMVPLSAALGLSLFIERFIEIFKNIPERFFSKNPKGRRLPKLKIAKNTEKKLGKKFEDLQESSKTEEVASSKVEELLQINRQLEKTGEKVERSKLEKRKGIIESELSVLEKAGSWEEQFSNAVIAVEPAKDPDDGLTTRAIMIQLICFALGIIAVRISGLQLFNSMLKHLNGGKMVADWVDFLLTGLLIGGGSKPIHLLIRFIT